MAGNGTPITYRDGTLQVPDDPIIPYIEGDGIGKDITPPSLRLVDEAVRKAYGGAKRIVWTEVLAGEKAFHAKNNHLPPETVEALRTYRVSIKGPLTTPVGEGFRSLNVTLRQVLDLYACVRPVRYFEGIEAPVKRPERLDVVIFRENTEDVYMGYEWRAGDPATKRIVAFLKDAFGVDLDPETALGLKPMSERASKRLIRAALDYCVRRKRRSVTLVHKGNIMKYTEGAFKTWGYEVAASDFPGLFLTEQELAERHNCVQPEGVFVIKDRIADNMFQQVLMRPEEFDVIALPNLNGDYLSDACAAQVGGLGIAPGANIGDGIAVFEATHGSAPKHAGLNKANPCSLLLSAVMMLEYLGWDKAAQTLRDGIAAAIRDRKVTYDLARPLGVEPLSTSDFCLAVADRL